MISKFLRTNNENSLPRYVLKIRLIRLKSDQSESYDLSSKSVVLNSTETTVVRDTDSIDKKQIMNN